MFGVDSPVLVCGTDRTESPDYPELGEDSAAAGISEDKYRATLAAVFDGRPFNAVNHVAVAVAGDWHGNTPWARSAIEAIPGGVGLLVHLGDFGLMGANFVGDYVRKVNRFAAARALTVWVVAGNHENHDWIEKQPVDDAGLTIVASHIRVLPRGFRFMIGDMLACAVGGAVSVDQGTRTPGHSWWPREELTEEQAQDAAAGGHADVMFTHDMPLGSGCPGLSHRALVEWAGEAITTKSYLHNRRLRDVAEALTPELLLHGHLHTRYSNTVSWVSPAGEPFDCTIHGLAADDDAGNLVLLNVAGTTITVTDLAVGGAR